MHILQTASFAKKFLKPAQLAKIDPNTFVSLSRLSIVLTKIRNSSKMARAITYKQLKAIKPKNMLPLLLKYGDFPLTTMIIELLGIDRLHVVYEEWCVQMLHSSQLTDFELEAKFKEKFENLAAKILLDGG